MNFNTTIYQRFARGKLLLTGEYLVLNGAKAIALPSLFGQSLNAIPDPSSPLLHWTAFDADGNCWLDASFNWAKGCSLESISIGDPSHLLKLLKAIHGLNPAFSFQNGWKVKTTLTFNKNWGLGTSSTLVALLADWTLTNPYDLLKASFGGSGYDVACAFAESPLWYQLAGNERLVAYFHWRPAFHDSLYFVYQGHKKDSREAMASYKRHAAPDASSITLIENIGTRLLATSSREEFNHLLKTHELIMSDVLGEPPVKDRLFAGFPGAIKSLGAWGGDFVLVSPDESNTDVVAWMQQRGYYTILPWKEMVL